MKALLFDSHPLKIKRCSTRILSASAFFLKKMFRGTLNLTQENHHFIVHIGKKINAVNGKNYQEHALYYTAHNN
jgi:hypothetical protein